MKKIIIASILGLAVGNVCSYGQGAIDFDTYDANGGNGIITTYGNGPSVGTAIGSTFTGELLYSLAPISDPATTAATAGAALNAGWSVGNTGSAVFGQNGAANGYVIATSNLNIPSGGQSYYFEIVAFNGASPTTSTYEGHSASFQATLVTGLTLPNADQLDNLVPFNVYQVVATPEPATLALVGLGAAALVAARRRKA